MAKPVARIAAVQFVFALGIAAIVAPSVQLQVVQRSRWTKEAERRRTEHRALPARRGTLYDRNGVQFAITQEFYHVGIAPNELADPAAAARTVAVALDIPLAAIQRPLKAGKKY